MSEKASRLCNLGLLLLAASVDASAADGDWQSMFSFNGFGTLGVVHSNNPDGDFVNNVFESRGAGESTSWSPAVDSKLGLQLTATPTEKLKAIVQLIIEQKWNGTYTPTLEWANLTYQVTPDFDVRGGRIVWPMFVRSESQNVGLANFSVRPSAELEAEMPNTHSDGLDATYRLHLGPTSHAITVFGGQSQEHYGDYVSAKSAATTLSADQVAQIFAGKASAFADGRKTHLLDLPEGADRSMFYTKSAGRDSAQMKAYWARIVFTGKGQPPTQVADADAVKKAVAADLNAVGYIDSDKVDSTVKVLATFK